MTHFLLFLLQNQIFSTYESHWLSVKVKAYDEIYFPFKIIFKSFFLFFAFFFLLWICLKNLQSSFCYLCFIFGAFIYFLNWTRMNLHVTKNCITVNQNGSSPNRANTEIYWSRHGNLFHIRHGILLNSISNLIIVMGQIVCFWKLQGISWQVSRPLYAII